MICWPDFGLRIFLKQQVWFPLKISVRKLLKIIFGNRVQSSQFVLGTTWGELKNFYRKELEKSKEQSLEVSNGLKSEKWTFYCNCGYLVRIFLRNNPWQFLWEIFETIRGYFGVELCKHLNPYWAPLEKKIQNICWVMVFFLIKLQNWC